MPDLGKYAGVVLMSYAISIGLLVLVVLISLRRGRAMRARLREVEDRQERDDD